MDKEDVRAVYLERLNSVKRFNVDAFSKWLESKTDFFVAPAATKGALAYEGALAARVYATLIQLEELYETQEKELPESALIAALLTGLSRVNTMVKDERPGKEGQYRMVRDATELPIGRCERGLFMAGRFFKLLPEEIVALRWFDLESCKVDEFNELAAYAEGQTDEKLKAMVKDMTPDAVKLQQYAAQKFPLVQMLQTAWILAADISKG